MVRRDVDESSSGARRTSGLGSSSSSDRVRAGGKPAKGGRPGKPATNYTLRNMPKRLDRAIRARAKQEDKSLSEVAIEALLRAFGMVGVGASPRDLSDIAGTWQADPKMDLVFEEQRRVDPELWQ
jgi:hypothetical protein